jgi:hypothetical protein
MKKRLLPAFAAIVVAACSSMPATQAPAPWTTLIDGTRGLDNFYPLGTANWRAEDGAIVADALRDKAAGYLVTKDSYRNFVLRAEVWVSDNANSGIYFRCSDPSNVTDRNCYEANLFDQRPDPTFGTGALTHIAKVSPMPKAGGKWNTYEVIAKGPRITLILNGQTTVDVLDPKFVGGPIALQYGAGVVKWRKVEIRPL